MVQARHWSSDATHAWIILYSSLAHLAEPSIWLRFLPMSHECCFDTSFLTAPPILTDMKDQICLPGFDPKKWPTCFGSQMTGWTWSLLQTLANGLMDLPTLWPQQGTMPPFSWLGFPASLWSRCAPPGFFQTSSSRLDAISTHRS